MHGPRAGRGLQGAAPLASRNPLSHYRPLHCSYSLRPDSPELYTHEATYYNGFNVRQGGAQGRKLCPMKSASYRFVPCRTRSYPVVHPVVPIVTTHGRERSTKI